VQRCEDVLLIARVVLPDIRTKVTQLRTLMLLNYYVLLFACLVLLRSALHASVLGWRDGGAGEGRGGEMGGVVGAAGGRGRTQRQATLYGPGLLSFSMLTSVEHCTRNLASLPPAPGVATFQPEARTGSMHVTLLSGMRSSGTSSSDGSNTMDALQMRNLPLTCGRGWCAAGVGGECIAATSVRNFSPVSSCPRAGVRHAALSAGDQLACRRRQGAHLQEVEARAVALRRERHSCACAPRLPEARMSWRRGERLVSARDHAAARPISSAVARVGRSATLILRGHTCIGTHTRIQHKLIHTDTLVLSAVLGGRRSPCVSPRILL